MHLMFPLSLTNIQDEFIEARSRQSDLSCVDLFIENIRTVVYVYVHAGISRPKGRLILGPKYTYTCGGKYVTIMRFFM